MLTVASVESFLVGTWLSLVEHSLGVRGVGSSNLPVPTKLHFRMLEGQLDGLRLGLSLNFFVSVESLEIRKEWRHLERHLFRCR